MQISISSNNMLLRSYRFWVNSWHDPSDVCEFINRYTTAVLFKMLPTLFAIPFGVISVIYTLFAGYELGYINIWNSTILDPFIISTIVIFMIAASCAIAVLIILFVALVIGLFNISMDAVKSPDSLKLITAAVSSKFNKFCVKIDYKD